jgi:hypothetical protein
MPLEPIRARAMIDTGAAASVVRSDVLRRLGTEPHANVPIGTAFTQHLRESPAEEQMYPRPAPV